MFNKELLTYLQETTLRQLFLSIVSGVTRVGVTGGGGNWRFHPEFFLKKLTTSLVIAVCKVMTFLLAVRPLSTVLSKFSHIFYLFHSGVTLEGVTRGDRSPSAPGDTTVSSFKKRLDDYSTHNKNIQLIKLCFICSSSTSTSTIKTMSVISS